MDEPTRIAEEALVRAGVSRDVARALAITSRARLEAMGVDRPMRKPNDREGDL